MTDKELMQQALIKAARFVIKALDEESAAYGPKDRIAHVDEAAAMLRAAVVQPDVPEVGFGNMPKKAAWVGLTDEEVEKIVDDNTQDDQGYDIWCSGKGVARSVEALLKERNT